MVSAQDELHLRQAIAESRIARRRGDMPYGAALVDAVLLHRQRVAEEIIFGHDKVSSGASSDIQHATSLARSMVTRWGMSDKLGPLQYEETQEGYLGYGGSARTFQSAETNKLIDAEIRALVDGGHKRATDILKTQIEKLHLLAQAMLEYETLTGEEIDQLLKDGKIDRPAEDRKSVV